MSLNSLEVANASKDDLFKEDITGLIYMLEGIESGDVFLRSQINDQIIPPITKGEFRREFSIAPNASS